MLIYALLLNLEKGCKEVFCQIPGTCGSLWQNILETDRKLLEFFKIYFNVAPS